MKEEPRAHVRTRHEPIPPVERAAYIAAGAVDLAAEKLREFADRVREVPLDDRIRDFRAEAEKVEGRGRKVVKRLRRDFERARRHRTEAVKGHGNGRETRHTEPHLTKSG